MHFFVQCKNINSIPFIFTLIKTNGSGIEPLSNPLRVLPITISISGPFIWSVNKSLSTLLDVPKPPIDPFFDKDGEKIIHDYWKQKIKEKLNIVVE